MSWVKDISFVGKNFIVFIYFKIEYDVFYYVIFFCEVVLYYYGVINLSEVVLN